MSTSKSGRTGLVNDDLLVIDGREIKPGVRIGQFEVVRKLGQGAMASVYLGMDVDLQRNVALKFLNRAMLATPGNEILQDMTEQRFIREARSAAMINHPNIAKIYTADFRHENWYIVMEFIDGECVQDIIDSGKSFTAREIVEFAAQIVSGLHHAWTEHTIIHRDIKPQNIMQNKRGVYKLVDMGLAKPVVKTDDDMLTLTTTGIPVGTPYYMAPEQAEGREDIDFRADIFALGATLHEMIIQEKTFNERSAPMVYLAQVKKKYRKVTDFRDDIPEALIQLIDEMLEPKLDDRISDYDKMLDRLDRCFAEFHQTPEDSDDIKVEDKTKRPVVVHENTVELPADRMNELREKGKKLAQTAKDEKQNKEREKAKKEEKEKQEPPEKHQEKLEEKPAPVPVELDQKPVQPSIYDQPDEDIHTANTTVLTPDAKDNIEKIVAEIKKRKNLPALDHNVMELSNVVRKANSRVADLTKVIQRDTSLSSNLLSTINSSLYAPKQPIESISSAVVLLGFEKVRSLAARLSIFYQAHQSLRDESLYKLLTSSYFAGTFTQNLTNVAGYRNPEEAFIAGLLHQMPRLILANTFPNKFTEVQQLVLQGVTFNRACEQVFGVGYPQICEAIHKAWNLPPGIACSFMDSAGRNGKSYLRPFIKESGHLADMVFGQVIGGKRELAAAEARIRDLLRRRDFNITEFMEDTCTKDETIRRFFHINEARFEQMLVDVQEGVAHEPDRAERKEYPVDLEQPVRIIPKSQRQLLDRWADQILHSAQAEKDINKAIEEAQEAIMDCIPSDQVVTVLLNAKKDRLIGRFHRGEASHFEPNEIDLDREKSTSKLVLCLNKEKSIRCTGSKRNLQLPAKTMTRLNVRQLLLVPIIVDDKSIGIYLVGRHDPAKRFSDSELAQVEVVAEALAKIFSQYGGKKRTQTLVG